MTPAASWSLLLALGAGLGMAGGVLGRRLGRRAEMTWKGRGRRGRWGP